MPPVIVEVAVSPIGRDRSPHAPLRPAQIAADLLACLAAGASVLHSHIDDFRLAGSAAAQRYAEGWRPVLDRHPDAILYPTVAASPPGDELGAYAHVAETIACAGGRMGVFDPGSLNLSYGSDDGQPGRGVVYGNDYATLDRVLTLYAAERIPASIAVYEPTFLRATLAYERAGRFVPGSFVKLYFGGACSFLDGRPGLSFGLPPTIAALDVYRGMMEGSGLPWAAAVLGGDIIAEQDFAAAVLARGGHLRVGLEDHAGPGTPTNAELVASAAALVRRCGRRVATSAEAADILGLMPAKVRQAATVA